MKEMYNPTDMLHAKNEFVERIKKVFPDTYERCEFYYGNPEKPQHNIPPKMKKRYIVCLFPCKKLFLVWDYEIHRKYAKQGAGLSSVRLNKSWDELLDCDKPNTFPYYKRMGTLTKAPYEKVYVVHVSDWQMFFQGIDYYMCFNDYDIQEDGNRIAADIIAQENNEVLDKNTRKRYSAQKLQRKAEFRKDVLNAYNHQCAICRCNIVDVLQAAHLHGYEVADTDLRADKAENGVCLCANHHLLYDSMMIDLDVSKGTVTANDPVVLTMPSWKVFVSNGEKLVQPNYEFLRRDRK